MTARPIVLQRPVAVLCEGQHDAAFLHAIARRIGRADALDLPFFEIRNGRWQGRDGFPHGSGAVPAQLEAVALQLRASPIDAARVRGILLLRDCGDDAASVLRETADACRAAHLPEPNAPGAWHGPADGLRTALLLLPDPQCRGSLETLCLDYLRKRHPAEAACLDAYFSCIGPRDPAPTEENRAKAMLASLVAAIAPNNPTQTLSGAFESNRHPPLIDVTAPLFTPFADALAALLA